MNNKIIAVSTDPNVGGTFLSWSLHYLNGHKEYFSYKKNSWNNLTDQPLTNNNAHNFEKNWVGEVDGLNPMLATLSTTDTKDFHVMYFHTFRNSLLPNDDVTDLTKKKINEAMDACSNRIVLSTNKNHNLYFSKFEQRGLESTITDEEHWDDFIKLFFNKSASARDFLDLKNVWGKREFLALNIKPDQVIKIPDEVDLTKSHLFLDTFDLYNTFDETVTELFDYLGLLIDQSRKEHWNGVYKQWQHLHFERIRFAWYFDQIIDHILNNYYMDLTRFNLDLIQEACIQHHLIYNYNLNLKTWQLEKFSNTQQLHNLLEPNTHQITDNNY